VPLGGNLIPSMPCRRWSLAELNITLAAFQHAFQDLQLLESTSFTKCHKALAFEKVRS
jgi:hypothetical protein